jgi:cytoskeletal protein CcmA (bactofilin family)
VKIKGAGSYIDSTGIFHEVKGKGIVSDDVLLQSLKVEGELEFDKISCDQISVEGKAKGGSLTAKTVSVEGKIKVSSLKVERTFELEGKGKIDNIEAAEIFIESQSSSIGKIKCKRLKIFNDCGISIGGVIRLKINDGVKANDSDSRIQIKSIEADKVELANCEVDIIRCNDAFIGLNCVIEKLFVAGECNVADNSTVGETIHV